MSGASSPRAGGGLTVTPTVSGTNSSSAGEEQEQEQEQGTCRDGWSVTPGTGARQGLWEVTNNKHSYLITDTQLINSKDLLTQVRRERKEAKRVKMYLTNLFWPVKWGVDSSTYWQSNTFQPNNNVSVTFLKVHVALSIRCNLTTFLIYFTGNLRGQFQAAPATPHPQRTLDWGAAERDVQPPVSQASLCQMEGKDLLRHVRGNQEMRNKKVVSGQPRVDRWEIKILNIRRRVSGGDPMLI